MSQGRPPALLTHEVDLEELSANSSQLDELPREELLRLLKKISNQQLSRHNTSPSSNSSSSGCSSSDGNHQHDQHRGHVKGKPSTFAALTATGLPTATSSGITRGGVVTWDSAKLQEVEGHADNTRNSPNDQQDHGVRNRPSLRTVSGVLSTDGSNRGSVSAVLPNTAKGAQAAVEADEEDEEKDASPTAAAAAKGDDDAAARATSEEPEAPYEGSGRGADTAEDGAEAAEAPTMTAPPPGFVSSTTKENASHSTGFFSPLSNLLDVDSITSPPGSLMRAAASFTSAALRYAHNVGMRSTNRYSCSSMSSSTYDTVDNTAAESSGVQHEQRQQRQQHSLASSPRHDGLSFSAPPVSQYPLFTNRGATEGDRFSALPGSEMSLRPPQMATLPPPRELSLDAARMPPWRGHLSLSLLRSTSETLLGRPCVQTGARLPQQQETHTPSSLHPPFASSAGPQASAVTPPQQTATLSELVPSTLLSPSSVITTTTSTATPPRQGTSTSSSSLSSVASTPLSTPSHGASLSSPRGGGSDGNTSSPHAPETAAAAADAPRTARRNDEVPVVSPPSLLSNEAARPVAPEAAPLFTLLSDPATSISDGDGSTANSNVKEEKSLLKRPSANSILQSSRGSLGRQGSLSRAPSSRKVSLALDPAVVADTPHRPHSSWRGGVEKGARLPSSPSALATPSPAPNSSNTTATTTTVDQGGPLAAPITHSPRPLRRAQRRAPKGNTTAASINTLVSVETAHTTSSTSTTANASEEDNAATGEFETWTHILSWDRGENGQHCATTQDRNRATASTATTTTTATSPTSSYAPSDQRGEAPPSPIHGTQPGEVSFSPQDSFLSALNLSSSAPELTRARQTASLHRVRHASTGDRYINNYRILKSLGRGSCGKVKLAYDEVESRLVAIKYVRRVDTRKRLGGLTVAQKQYNAFMREVEVMKTLRHRNIVSLYEVIDDPSADKLYLVMQYVDKGVVAKVAVRANSDYVCDPIPPAQLVRYAREMLTGLQYLHRHDVVHRDLKPDNILVSRDGHAYLADFGVAETFGVSYRQRTESLMAASMAASLAMSVTGNRVGGPQVLGTKGTPLFIAPELWDGTKSYGKPVDMWATGVTLFTLLVGKLPFRSPEDIIDAAFMPTVPDEFGEKWRVLLNGLLHRAPQARWTVEEALRYVTVNLARKESRREKSHVALSETPCGSGASATSSTGAPATAVPLLSCRRRNSSNNNGDSKPSSPLQGLAPLRRPVDGAPERRAESCSPAPSLHPRALLQHITGTPRVEEEAAMRSSNSSADGRASNTSHSAMPATSLALARCGSAMRPHILEGLDAARLPLAQAGRSSGHPISVTHIPTSTEHPPSPRQHQYRQQKQRIPSSLEEGGGYLDTPSFGDDTSDTVSAATPTAGKLAEEAESATAYAPQTKTARTITAHRPFSVRWGSRPPAEGPYETGGGPSQQQQSSSENTGGQVSSPRPGSVGTPLVPLSAILAAHSSEVTPRPSSRTPSAAAKDEVRGDNTSAVYNFVPSSRLMPLSVPRPSSPRIPEKDKPSTTPTGPGSTTTSPHAALPAPSKSERSGAVTRPAVPPRGDPIASTPTRIRSGGNVSNNNNKTAARATVYSFSPRVPGSTESREHGVATAPMEGAAAAGGREGLHHPRSPARLPGITSASSPTPPSSAPMAASLSAPPALRRIKASQRNSPLRNGIQVNEISLCEVSCGSRAESLLEDARK
ncbi:putative protein kinase [Leptomonas pyrrhocoris]|uniref:Protein kinase domain-containing protein n=1 Tax=Leptomonas pyrrhocoris TaxID=157538 RepID=A0A0M9FVH7_LEPPY|nr:putative protein kinase [Leptomonas pyrrhocoris]KPA76925.1 putative protein kinase [Leptomonas pyrrhocoris]|eukprot:XP_015655364.1 putative protein kinase [Leptomonas pyrrhocoris]